MHASMESASGQQRPFVNTHARKRPLKTYPKFLAHALNATALDTHNVWIRLFTVLLANVHEGLKNRSNVGASSVFSCAFNAIHNTLF